MGLVAPINIAVFIMLASLPSRLAKRHELVFKLGDYPHEVGDVVVASPACFSPQHNRKTACDLLCGFSDFPAFDHDTGIPISLSFSMISSLDIMRTSCATVSTLSSLSS